jgi:homoprotocatechuate degradation regulator HpaR
VTRKPTKLTHRNLPMLLLQAREQVIARFRPILNEHGVTEQQWRIVRVLLEQGPLEPREIVAACCISSPSLAGILARMDDLGLVRRERVDRDQRRVKVSLTPKSRSLAARIAPQVERVYADIEARIGREFTAEFYRTLDNLIAGLLAMPMQSRPARQGG